MTSRNSWISNPRNMAKFPAEQDKFLVVALGVQCTGVNSSDLRSFLWVLVT